MPHTLHNWYLVKYEQKCEPPCSFDWVNLHTHLQAAESLFERDGDFLVRDSSSAPGDYVLSCLWKNSPMHFKVIKVVLRPKKVRPCHILLTCTFYNYLINFNDCLCFDITNFSLWICNSLLKKTGHTDSGNFDLRGSI